MYGYSSSESYQSGVTYDLSLRKFMLQVYNYMTIALAISGLVSLGISMSPNAMSFIWGTPFKWVAIFAFVCYNWLSTPTIFGLKFSSFFFFERKKIWICNMFDKRKIRSF